MNIRLLPWLTFGVLLSLLLGLAFGKGFARDPRAWVFMGAIGVLLGLVGFFAVSAAHRAWKIDDSKTNTLAVIGALLGAICGGVIGARLSVFRRLMISIFNPDIPERDVGTFFGATGGVVLGALFGACLVSGIALLFRHRHS